MKINRYWTLLLLILGSCTMAMAQQWGAYTLYSTSNSSTAYLIDTNNVVYHTWTFTNANTGYSSYLLPGQVLCRSVRVNNPSYQGGGLTGRIQKVDWNGNVTWDYTHSASTYMLHHDHCPLPNGNVLMISYENKTPTEVSDAGCSQSITVQSEKIIEVQPTGPTTGTIVWEWHLWDHLVQNVDAQKANYQSSISAHPELMNINYSIQRDWIHMNGIDYNADLDQIVVSSHNLDEIYVIDHSTTTAEAASHAGGNSGKGGDFLYRWGNPAAYGAGNASNQILKVVHDAHWIPQGVPNAGRLVGFNNDGISSQQSCIDQIDPPYNGYVYDLNPGPAYSPGSYTYRTPCNGRSSNMGNSQQLPNGNTLICMATLGTIYEIDPGGNLLWTKQVTGMIPQSFRYSECYVNGGVEPTALVTASVDSVCPGDSIVLNLTPGGGSNYTYNWASYPTGFSSTDQNPTVTPSASTTYYVTVTSGGCSVVASVPVTVVAEPIPTITQVGDTLFASPASNYQWYLNGNQIPFASSNFWVPTQDGDYTVWTQNDFGCTALSAPYTYTFVGIDAGLGAGWRVYPNPSNGTLYILHPDLGGEPFVISVADARGRRVAIAANAQSLDLSTLADGMYFVRIHRGDALVTTQKISLIR